MSIEIERKQLLKRVKKEGRPDYKALSRKIKMPYSTLLSLVKEETLGAIRSWIKIERYFARRG